MSRFVQIETTKWRTYVIELNDEDSDEVAYDLVDPYDEATLTALSPDNVECAIRHADVVERL